jgi:RimJ/RimL family protein N-acetyltransferase
VSEQHQEPDRLAGLTWPRETARLLLRRATPSDAAAMWAYRSLPAVSEWITSAPADLEAFTALQTRARLRDTLVVSLRDVPGEVVGDLMVQVQDAWSQAEVRERAAGTQVELGWAFHPASGGQGYATEAVADLLRMCFWELGIRRVEAHCFAANRPSWRLMERLGMRRETHAVKESLHRSGEWMDGLTYALLADEWRTRDLHLDDEDLDDEDGGDELRP